MKLVPCGRGRTAVRAGKAEREAPRVPGRSRSRALPTFPTSLPGATPAGIVVT